MSEENAELLERWRESGGRQDAEATVACLHDDVCARLLGRAWALQRRLYRGPAEAVGILRSMWEAWDEAVIEFAEVIDCGTDRTITVNVFHSQGRSSGVKTVARVANLWSFRDGLIHRAKLFQSKDEALEAVGLSE